MSVFDKIGDFAKDAVRGTIRYPVSLISGKKVTPASEYFKTGVFKYWGKMQDKVVPFVLAKYGAEAKAGAIADAKKVNTNVQNMSLISLLGLNSNKVTTEGSTSSSPKTGTLNAVADAFNGMLGGAGSVNYSDVIKNSGIAGNISFGTSKTTQTGYGPAAGVVGIVLPIVLIGLFFWGIFKVIKWIAKGGRK